MNANIKKFVLVDKQAKVFKLLDLKERENLLLLRIPPSFSPPILTLLTEKHVPLDRILS